MQLPCESNEYYGYTLYYIIIVAVCLFIFWTLFLFFGLMIRKSLKRKELWVGFKRMFISSITITFLIFIVGFISYSIKQGNYDKEYEIQRKKNDVQKLQEFSNTVDSLQIEIKKDSNNSRACFALGMLYRKNGDYNKSIEYYKIAIQRDSTIKEYQSELEYSENVKTTLSDK
jgi:tetratricopeptide (TPR) repeat protein